MKSIKRLILVALILLISVPAFAAWTVTITLDRTMDWTNKQQMYVFKFACTSDAGNSGDQTLSTLLTTTYGLITGPQILKQIAGGLLYAVKYEPGAVIPTSASTITIDEEVGALIFSEVVTAAGTPQVFDGAVDAGFSVPVTDVVLAATTLADTKTANIYIWILK